jgi:hypothetical protein
VDEGAMTVAAFFLWTICCVNAGALLVTWERLTTKQRGGGMIVSVVTCWFAVLLWLTGG